MSNKFYRKLIAVFTAVVSITFACICVQGIIASSKTGNPASFVECLIRCTLFLVFAVFYYSSFSIGIGTETLLFPIYIFSSILTEIHILSDYELVTGLTLLNTFLGVKIELFAALMACFSLAGYGIFYMKNENTVSSFYTMICIVSSLLISTKIPKTADYYKVWSQPYVIAFFSVLFTTLVIISVVLLITDAPGSNRFRHVAALLLITGNALNLSFNTVVMNSIATLFSTFGCLFIIVVAKRTDMKL